VGFWGIIRRSSACRRNGGIEQFVKFHSVTTGNLFKREKAGIVLNPKLVKLIELVAYTALFGCRLLRPATGFSQLTKPLLKQFGGGVPHSSNFRLTHLTAHSLKVAFG